MFSSFAIARAFNRPGLWTYYSPEVFEQARKSGDIVLVKFTAAWCANCQYVEQTVFTDQATLDLLKDRKVVMIKADLTRSEASGWPLLKKLNPSGGIPLTAIYSPGSDEPIQLTSIYTTADLIDALKNSNKSQASLDR
jgi:thiol:disulfide interchange protein